ncbi:NAD(P)H-dependent oxidoreductase subunit E [Candidatus Woesearchaeota archaeon]|nr:NAD(P)H-dependent oxidoreductase subunit E [Candidatus Woesearchaeota archaeon]
MVFLRKVKIHEQDYYYLFRCESNPFKKYKKYIGTNKPNKLELKKLEKQFLEEIQKNPDTQEIQEKNIIELLQEIQEKNKYISEEAIIKISKELGIPAINLYGVLTFYSQFKLKEPGKNHVCVCRGTACHVKKSDSLLKSIEELLKIKSGETTKDKLFSLEEVNCIGACAKAPAIMINQKVYGEQNKEKTKKIIQELRINNAK